MSDSKIVNYSVHRTGREALALLQHVLTATVGTAFAGSEFSGVYHAKTLEGAVTEGGHHQWHPCVPAWGTVTALSPLQSDAMDLAAWHRNVGVYRAD